MNQPAIYYEEAERMAERIETAGECQAAVEEFNRLISRAMNKGHVLWAHNVRALYLAIKAINDEIDEDEAEEKRVAPLYAAADKMVNAFADIIEHRGSIPDRLYKLICDSLVEWAGPINFHLSGDELRESMTQSLGEAVMAEMEKGTGR